MINIIYHETFMIRGIGYNSYHFKVQQAYQLAIQGQDAGRLRMIDLRPTGDGFEEWMDYYLLVLTCYVTSPPRVVFPRQN